MLYLTHLFSSFSLYVKFLLDIYFKTYIISTGVQIKPLSSGDGEFKMAIIRSQYGVVSASFDLPDNGTLVTVDIPRPSNAAETNTIDWVTRPAFRKEFESGRCVITLSSGATAADVFLRKVEILALNPGNSLTPLNLSFSMFPDVPGPGMTQLLRTVLDTGSVNAYATNADITKDLLKNILLRSGEFVRLTLVNPAGGTGLVSGATALARYDLGLNAGNYGSLPLLI
jgi:hypothetical protein